MWTYHSHRSAIRAQSSARQLCSRHSLPSWTSAVVLFQLVIGLLLATNKVTYVAASSRVMLFATGEGAQATGSSAGATGGSCCPSGAPAAVLGDLNLEPWSITSAVFPDTLAKWIWRYNTYLNPSTASDHATFCKSFVAMRDTTVILYLAADAECGVVLNGADAGYYMGGLWSKPIAARLPTKAGTNVLQLRCQNTDPSSFVGVLATVLDPVGNVLARTDGTWTAHDVFNCTLGTEQIRTMTCSYNYTTRSYVVRCRDGYDGYNASLLTCKDIDECQIYNHPSTKCVNQEGSYDLGCADGYDSLNETTHTCTDIDECAGADKASVRCNNTVGSYVASCQKGYRDFNPQTMKCADIDECEGVHLSVACTNLPGSYKERCAAGHKDYNPKTRTCVRASNISNLSTCEGGRQVSVLGSYDTYPWNVGPSYPDPSASWIWWWSGASTNASAADHATFCKIFQATPSTEATLYLAVDSSCDVFLNNALIGSVVGGYSSDESIPIRLPTKTGTNTIKLRCRNNETTNVNYSPENSVGVLASIFDSTTGEVLARSDETWTAADVNPCGTYSPSIICSLNYMTGKVSRTCAPGYWKYDSKTVTCSDINECRDADPAGSTECTNTPGGFEERCAAGYENYDLQSRTCHDTDECKLYDIHYTTICHDTVGSWRVECKPGYWSELDGTPGLYSCTDINECANADVSVKCVNLDGSFTEGCAPGFKNYNTSTRTCVYSPETLEACKGGRNVSVQGASSMSPWKVTSFADRDAKWIWWWRGSYRRAPSADHATFCQTFNASKAANATLHLMADVECDVYFNGRWIRAVSSGGWPANALQLPLRVIPGYNSLQLRCYNNESFGGSPAGVLAAVLDSSTGKVLLRTDATWKALDVDECTIADATVVCSRDAIAGTYTRTCAKGYAGYNATSMACSDVDECKTLHQVHLCTHADSCEELHLGQGDKCINQPGSFKLDCLRGYKEFNDYNTYEDCYFFGCEEGAPSRWCDDIDECRKPDKSVACTNLAGSYVETCARGYRNYDAKTRKCAPFFLGNESIQEVIKTCDTGANVIVLGNADMASWEMKDFPDSGAKWIWSRPGTTPGDVAAFGKVFYTPADMEASLVLVADGKCDVFINGRNTTISSSDVWPYEAISVPLKLKAGRNSIQLFCQKYVFPGDTGAGALATVLSPSGKLLFHTDSSWQSLDLGECMHTDPSIVCTYDSTTGKVSRKCAPGYENYNDTTRTCTDINECLGADPSVVCANLPGSYNYICAPGYATFITGGKCA